MNHAWVTILVSWSLAIPLPAETYYVSAAGDDAASGRTEGTAWKTLAKVNASRFDPGDVILLRRGDHWRETLTPPSDHLRIGNYGSGALPVVSGADAVTGLEETAPGLWSAGFPVNPVQLFVDGERGRRLPPEEKPARFREWSWDPELRRLTVCGSAPGHRPGVEATVRDHGLDLNGRTGLTVAGLAIERAGWSGIRADTLTESRIEACRIEGCYVNGIRAADASMRRGITIRGCRIEDCGGSGIGFGGRLDRWVIEENEIVRCGILTKEIVGFGDDREAAFEWTSGIKIWGWGGPGWVGDYAIRNNIVRDCLPVEWAAGAKATHGHGIWCDEVLKPTARPRIHGNVVHDCYSRGIYLEKTDDHDVYENIVYRCAQVRYAGSLEAQSNSLGYDVEADRPDDQVPRRVSGNRIFRNTAVGGWWSLAVHCSTDGCSISDTEVYENICVGPNGRSASLYFHGGGANDGVHGDGNRYRRNNFGPEGGGWVWGDALCRTYAELEKLSAGGVTESVPGNPRFVDPSNGDFELGEGSPGRGAAWDGGNLGALPRAATDESR